MKKWTLLKLFGLFLFGNTVALAQTLVLNPQHNRFLMNEPGQKPRLDLIIRSFTDTEKRNLGPLIVMDTLTKPTVRLLRTGTHQVRLGRMAEQAFLVIRDPDELPQGYFFKVDNQMVGAAELSLQVVSYQVGKELCLAGPSLPFGKAEVTISLCESTGKTMSELRITFVYPKPELVYVSIQPEVDFRVSDTTEFRKFLPFFIRNKPTYSSGSAVPDRLCMGEQGLFFGFKKVYYDGKVQDSRVYYRAAVRDPWRGTSKEKTPFIELAQNMENWNWLTDGSHELQFSYTREHPNVGTYPFTVNHHWYSSLGYHTYLTLMTLRLVTLSLFRIPWLAALLLCLILYFWFKSRLRKTKDVARKTNLELQSIQAQLNPHFVFNALGSLQGLINTQDLDRANTYLSGFSKLLRSTLYQSSKELVPLSVEMETIENYLKLEQLRFGFVYERVVDPRLQNLDPEVPTLLIQPVIENAIKHGISGMRNQGRLRIDFAVGGSDLVITIQDNGKGYDTASVAPGKGLALTHERIKLLNKRGYRMNMQTDSTGTRVTFTLKNWL